MHTVDIQHASSLKDIPTDDEFRRWVGAALTNDSQQELTIRIVDPEEIQLLNQQYRNKDKTTNVLSFPCDLPAEVDIPLLGDIIICAQVVLDEATTQQKTLKSHWAHMVVHGTLHLLGYDHIEDDEAEEMEALETKIITELGFPAPYLHSTLTQQDSLEHKGNV